MADFAKDEELDAELIREVFEKKQNYITIAEDLSKKFTQKYGAEFRGFVKVEFDVHNNSWILHCGKDHTMNFENEEVNEIPSRIRLLREANSKKRKIDTI